MRIQCTGQPYLSSKVQSTSLAHLQDEWGFLSAGCLKGSYDGRRRGDIDGWYSELLLLSIVEEGEDVISSYHACFPSEDVLGHCGALWTVQLGEVDVGNAVGSWKAGLIRKQQR